LLLTVSGHDADTLRDPRKGREARRGKQAGGVASALHHQAAVLLHLCNDGDWIDIKRLRPWVSSFGVYRRHEGKKKAQARSNAVLHRETPSPLRLATSAV
jgi:hypothetical protein